MQTIKFSFLYFQNLCYFYFLNSERIKNPKKVFFVLYTGIYYLFSIVITHKTNLKHVYLKSLHTYGMIYNVKEDDSIVKKGEQMSLRCTVTDIQLVLPINKLVFCINLLRLK